MFCGFLYGRKKSDFFSSDILNVCNLREKRSTEVFHYEMKQFLYSDKQRCNYVIYAEWILVPYTSTKHLKMTSYTIFTFFLNISHYFLCHIKNQLCITMNMKIDVRDSLIQVECFDCIGQIINIYLSWIIWKLSNLICTNDAIF